MLHFITLFDVNYLTRGIALYNSLIQHTRQGIKLYIVALDQQVGDEINKILASDNIVLIDLLAIEKKYPELLNVKLVRTKVEYYFTLSPYLPSYVLATYPDVNQITSLDSDIYFFSDPSQIFETYPEAEILLTPHNFPSNLKYLEKYGRFNVSFQSFKRTINVMNCLRKWREDCIEFCNDTLDIANNRYADQKYLDNWNAQFENVVSIDLPGSGLAPWNISNFNIQKSGNDFLINNEPLIFFHFHHLRFINRFQIAHGLENYHALNVVLNKAVKSIYEKYILSLKIHSKFQSHNVERYMVKKSNSLYGIIFQASPYWLFLRPMMFHVSINNKIILFSFAIKNRVDKMISFFKAKF
ncbi:MAG: hypothetical protein RL596_1927 [Bacteroidota bacterium]